MNRKLNNEIKQRDKIIIDKKIVSKNNINPIALNYKSTDNLCKGLNKYSKYYESGVGGYGLNII